MKCAHELDATEEYRPHPTEPRSVLWRRICWHCGAWLSLGPANDDDERVKVEIRAAELAQHIADGVVDILPLRLQGWSTDEDHGYHNYTHPNAGDCSCRDLVFDVERNWHSGYLAACIAAHEEEAE